MVPPAIRAEGALAEGFLAEEFLAEAQRAQRFFCFFFLSPRSSRLCEKQPAPLRETNYVLAGR